MPNHSTPGIDGFSSEFFKTFAGTDGVDTQTDTNCKTTKTPIANSFATLLSHAFREMLLTGTMTPNMRTGIVSLLYKDKGPRDDLRHYRPITVLCTLYKILSRAMALRLGEVIHHLVDSIQAAFQPGKRTSDVTRMVQDIIDYCKEHELSGVLAFCDQEKAYDRVNWDYMFKVLKQLNMHDEFITLVRLLLHENNLLSKSMATLEKVSAQKTESSKDAASHRFSTSWSSNLSFPSSTPQMVLMDPRPLLMTASNSHPSNLAHEPPPVHTQKRLPTLTTF